MSPAVPDWQLTGSHLLLPIPHIIITLFVQPVHKTLPTPPQYPSQTYHTFKPTLLLSAHMFSLTLLLLYFVFCIFCFWCCQMRCEWMECWLVSVPLPWIETPSPVTQLSAACPPNVRPPNLSLYRFLLSLHTPHYHHHTATHSFCLMCMF